MGNALMRHDDLNDEDKKAMTTFININADLYKIYNLRWTAALALGEPDAYSNKDIYDRRTVNYQVQVQSYNADQDLAILDGQLDQYHYQQYHDVLKQRYLTNWVGEGLVLLLTSCLMIYSWMVRSRNNWIRAVLGN